MVAFGSSGALRLASFRVRSGLAPSRALRPAPSRAFAPSRVLVSCAFLRPRLVSSCASRPSCALPRPRLARSRAPRLPASCAFPRLARSRALRPYVLRVRAPAPAPRAQRPASCAFPHPGLAPPAFVRSSVLGSCGAFGVWGCLRWGCFGLLGWAPSRPPSTQASRADRRRGRQPLGFSCGLRGVAAPATICTPVGGSTADGMAWA